MNNLHDLQDALEFESRVSALLAEIAANREYGHACELPENHPRYEDCPWCILKAARLAVEAEMESLQ